MTDEIQKGGCLCGNINYEFNKSSSLTAHHCHCIDCQKSTGSGKATIMLIPKDELKISGELKFYTVTGSSGSHLTRGFCENCGSPLISFVEESPDIRFIKLGSLNDSSWVTVESSFWSSTANSWSPIDEEIFNFTHNPDFS